MQKSHCCFIVSFVQFVKLNCAGANINNSCLLNRKKHWENTIHMLGNIVSRPLRDRICKIVVYCLSTICAGVKGLSCYVPAVCLFSSVLRLLGGGATCSHLPLPNPHICSSAKANLLPHLTALKSFIPSTPVRCNIWLLETILLVSSLPPPPSSFAVHHHSLVSKASIS